MIRFRASSFAQIMGSARSIDPALLVGDLAVRSRKKVKTDEDKALLEPLLEATLSATAKTFLNGMASEFVFGYSKTIGSKYFDKGIQCEDAAIQLYNNVFFTRHAKNTVRLPNEWATGECDILVPGKKIIDIKNAWSLDTFPATSDDVAEEMKAAGYDYQGRVYMALWDVDEFEVAYCMVSTPEKLRKWEQIEIHEVDHINPALRITRAAIHRCPIIEKKMEAKAAVAREYLKNRVAQINIEHRY